MIMLSESNKITDANGEFLTLDDAMSTLIGNLSEDEVDEAIGYFSRVCKALNQTDKPQNVVYYRCSESWFDPADHRDVVGVLKSMYKNGRYNSGIGAFNGKKFVTDHFDTGTAFGLYATSEDIIDDIIMACADSDTE